MGSDLSLQEQDKMVIDQLGQSGVDLSKPVSVIHYLYFPSIDAANSAANELRDQDFTTELQPSADVENNPPNPWLVLATKVAVVDLEAADESRSFLEAQSVKLGGEYDGWEVEVSR